MTNPSRPPPKPVACLLALACAVAATALTPTEWRYRQEFAVSAPGLVRVELPESTFDAAAPDLRDLRILDADGREQALLLDRPPAARAHALRPASFVTRLESGATVLTLATGTAQPLAAVRLETPRPFFLRPARVEISADGDSWTLLDDGVPLFRQWGAEQLEVALDARPAAWIRVTVKDDRTGPMPFSGAQLLVAAGPAPALVEASAQISRREEYADETVLTLALGGRHLPLAALVIDTPEALFLRRVTIAARELAGDTTRERVVGSGTIYRVALDGAPPRSQLAVRFDHPPAHAELLVHVHHGDSPPLALTGVQLERHPVSLLFHAPAPGTCTLLSGNAQADAPRYDLAGFAGEMRSARAFVTTAGARQDTPDYRPRDTLAVSSLPEITLTGAPLDTRAWTHETRVHLTTPGIQELELDPAVLSGARADLGDLRLMRGGNQVPYVLEHTDLARPLTLPPVAAPDAQRPHLSRWELALPHPGLPLRHVTLATTTSLFQRELRLYERVTAANGRTYERTLASGSWQRQPTADSPATRRLELTARPETDRLFLETDNGDNPPLALEHVVVAYPVTRLIFKARESDGFTLVHGHPASGAPRYDLGLVAATLLTSPRHPARLEETSARAPGFGFQALRGPRGGAIFWGALGLVVVVLFVVIARLLPKPPDGAGRA